MFFIGFIVALILQFQPIVVLSLFGLRFIIQLLIFNKSMKLLAERDLIFLAPIVELILLIVYPMITLSNLFMKKNKWK